MDKLTITYIHSTDTWYFPNKELYVGRFMFLYAHSDYLAHMLGLEFLDKNLRESLFLKLAQEPKSDHIELNFTPYKEQ